jgi:hypothetical protein
MGIRVLILSLVLLAGCSKSEWKLPAEIEGGWKLNVLPPNQETFELGKRLAAKRSMMGGYEGPGKLFVSAFDLGNGVAFEQVQKWRAQPGKIVFNHGSWFVLLESEGMDSSQLSKLATLVERTMPD